MNTEEEPQLELETNTPQDPAQDTDAASSISEPEIPVPIRGVLTNRWNLIEFLSRRLIVPSGVIKNYYQDLMVHTPGKIPVVQTPISQEMLESVTAEGSNQFPVFIEVSDTVPLGTTEMINWDEVKCVHFISEEHRGDHQANVSLSANVPTFDNLEVRPEYFAGGSVASDELTEPADDQADLRIDRVSLTDRWSGAVLAIFEAFKNHGSTEAAEAIARLLKDDGSTSDLSLLPALRNMRAGKEPGKGRGPDQQLFTEIIPKIQAGLPDDRAGFVKQLCEDTQLEGETSAQLARVADLLDSRTEFQPFKEASNPTVRGLFIALRRPQLDTLVEWAFEEAGAQLEAVVIAAALHGIAQGRHRLPINLRPEELDKYLASIELAAVLGNQIKTEPVIAKELDEDGGSTHLISFDRAEITLDESPPPLVDLVESADLSNNRIKDICLVLIEDQGWDQQAVRTIIKTPEFTYADGQLVMPGALVFEHEVVESKFIELLAGSNPDSDAALKLRRALVKLKNAASNNN